MAISQEQADTANVFHQPNARPCESRQGPIRWRRNGATKRWKRFPGRFEIPVKFGLYSTDRLRDTDSSITYMHTGADCPVAPEGHN